MTKTSELTRERLLSLLEYEKKTGHFIRKVDWYVCKKGEIAGRRHHSGCIEIIIDKVNHRAHRLAFLAMGEPVPELVDHINGNNSDNRWSNLRPATKSQNRVNSDLSGRNKHGYTGVSFHKGGKLKPWSSRIKVEGRAISLGYFPTREEAGAAYESASKKYFGVFSRAA